MTATRKFLEAATGGDGLPPRPEGFPGINSIILDIYPVDSSAFIEWDGSKWSFVDEGTSAIEEEGRLSRADLKALFYPAIAPLRKFVRFYFGIDPLPSNIDVENDEDEIYAFWLAVDGRLRASQTWSAYVTLTDKGLEQYVKDWAKKFNCRAKVKQRVGPGGGNPEVLFSGDEASLRKLVLDYWQGDVDSAWATLYE
jgi:hypothetical protein